VNLQGRAWIGGGFPFMGVANLRTRGRTCPAGQLRLFRSPQSVNSLGARAISQQGQLRERSSGNRLISSCSQSAGSEIGRSKSPSGGLKSPRPPGRRRRAWTRGTGPYLLLHVELELKAVGLHALIKQVQRNDANLQPGGCNLSFRATRRGDSGAGKSVEARAVGPLGPCP
jgi:hypothetical protein